MEKPSFKMSEGISLRDYFAAQAMSAMITTTNSSPSIVGTFSAKILAENAYKVADTMIDQRNEKDIK